MANHDLGRKPRSDKGTQRKPFQNAHIQVRLNGDPSIRPQEAQVAAIWHRLVDEHGNPKSALMAVVQGYEESRRAGWKPTTQVTVDKQMQTMLKRAVELMDMIAKGGMSVAAGAMPAALHEDTNREIADFTYDAQALMGSAVFFDDGNDG